MIERKYIWLDSCLDIFMKSKIGKFLNQRVVESGFRSVTKIKYNGCKLKFCTPNWISTERARSFATKEPETLDWIDSLNHNKVLYDIGANLGIYSIYAAIKHKNLKVYAIEPSVYNLELLQRNIVLNNLEDRITIIPLALNSIDGINKLNYTTVSWGGAWASFGQTYNRVGKPLDILGNYSMAGTTIDSLHKIFNIEMPDAIKMDVDGIEHLILQGAKQTLNSKSLKKIIIEVNTDFEENATLVHKYLKNSRWNLSQKLQSDFMSQHGIVKNTFNEIWVR